MEHRDGGKGLSLGMESYLVRILEARDGGRRWLQRTAMAPLPATSRAAVGTSEREGEVESEREGI